MSDRAGQGRRALDEALRLLDVLQAARPAAGAAPAGPAAGASAGPSAGPDGAHAGGECAVCPVCRGIAYLRGADPDAVDRITGAVADLGAALRDLLGADRAAPASGDPAAPAGAAGVEPDGPDDGAEGTRRVQVQRIDVTDDEGAGTWT